MTQSRKKSLIETITQTVVGLLLSFAIQLVIYPALEIPVKLHQNIIITSVFFGSSILRGYIIRRIFNKKN